VTNLASTRRALIAARNAVGADTPIGHGYSNINELLKQPVPPADLIQYQTDRIARLLGGSQ
jgi:hypothetical protein